MRQINKIAHLLVLLFFGISLVFFLSFKGIKGLFGIEELNTTLVVYFLLIGLILFLIAFGTGKMVRNGLEEEISKKEAEKKELKATLYDLEKGIKLTNLERKIDQKDEGKETSTIRPRQNFK
jgi:Tfp pilus assembly protein PilO